MCESEDYSSLSSALLEADMDQFMARVRDLREKHKHDEMQVLREAVSICMGACIGYAKVAELTRHDWLVRAIQISREYWPEEEIGGY